MITGWYDILPLATATAPFDSADYIQLSRADLAEFGLPVSMALAAVALIGYIFGQRTRTKMMAALDERRQQELARAARIAWQLENIAETLRKDLVSHHAQVAAFKRRLRQARDYATDAAWEHLCAEAEAMLGPTMQLAHQLSCAYDQIRQQSDALETFTQGRTDPLTGVGNGRALEQQLRVLLAAAARDNSQFCIALVSLDRVDAGATCQALAPILPMLPKLAGVIRDCLRGPDFVARYGDEEFVVVMPKTTLAGAKVFGDRLRQRVAKELAATICCGIAQAHGGDDVRSLLARADSALYSAKAAGPNRLFVHTGSHIREHNPAAGTADRGGAGSAGSSNSGTSAATQATSDTIEESASGGAGLEISATARA